MMHGRIAWSPAVRLLVAMLVGLSADAAQAQGRRTNITLTGFPLTTTGTTVLDFDAGSVTVGTTGFTVDLITNSGGGFSPRVTTVGVSCALPCPASGTLASGGLQWRRADLATWNAITTAFVTVESRTATFGDPASDPWSNSLVWRYVLSYTGTPPTAATQYFIQFQLQVTAP